MRILLSPSERKTPPLLGPTLDLPSLSFPMLTEARRAVAGKLASVSRSKNALSALGLGKRAANAVRLQGDLYNLPCAPALSVYAGPFYKAAQLRPGDDVWIFSALFGLIQAEDLIPGYRLSMSVTLPRVGRLSSFWKRELAGLRCHDVCIDMRSDKYQVWNPSEDWWKVYVTGPEGRVHPHQSEHYTGLLTRALLDADSSDIVGVAESIGRVGVEDGGTRFKILTLIVE